MISPEQWCGTTQLAVQEPFKPARDYKERWKTYNYVIAALWELAVKFVQTDQSRTMVWINTMSRQEVFKPARDFKESWKAYMSLLHCEGLAIKFTRAFLAGYTSSHEQYDIDIYTRRTTKLLTPIIKSFVTLKVLIQNKRTAGLWHELYPVCLYRVLWELKTTTLLADFIGTKTCPGCVCCGLFLRLTGSPQVMWWSSTLRNKPQQTQPGQALVPIHAWIIS